LQRVAGRPWRNWHCNPEITNRGWQKVLPRYLTRDKGEHAYSQK